MRTDTVHDICNNRILHVCVGTDEVYMGNLPGCRLVVNQVRSLDLHRTIVGCNDAPNSCSSMVRL